MNKRGKLTIWDYLIWIGIALILIWAILKSIGIINSPIWLEMIPYYGIGISAIGLAYKIGTIKNVIDSTSKNVKRLLSLEEKFNQVEYNQRLCMQGKLKDSPYDKS